jgi:hypothetical protein
LLRYLLTSEVKTYQYAVPREAVIEKMTEIFNKSGKFLSDPDFDGCFTEGNSFEMSVDSGVVTFGNVKFGSILYGKVRAYDSNQTIIETEVKARFPIKLTAIVIPLVGFVSLYLVLLNFSWQSCLTAVAMILLSPLICNWFAGVFNATIRERFDVYIDREIRKSNAPNIGLAKAGL